MEEIKFEKILNQIQTLLHEKDFKKLRGELDDLFPMDIAALFEHLDGEDEAILFRLLSKDKAAEVFSHLDSDDQKGIVAAISSQRLTEILEELNFDDKIDFLEEMPANFVKTVLAAADPAERKLINQFLRYKENSAGSLMTIEYVALKKNMTVGQALGHIKRVGEDRITINTCYVLDKTRKLEGIVSLRKLVLAERSTLIGNLMNTDIVLGHASDDQEEIVEQFKKYDLTAVPIVDREKRLLGIITIDDIVDVIEKENTEDIQKMAAITPSDADYMDSGVITLARKRVLWLLILMISATFTGAIITHFQEMLSTAIVLTAFIPMLMNSGGNAGNQTATLIIRGMALGDIRIGDVFRVIWKEFRVSLIVGTILATVNFLRLMLFGDNDFMISVVVSLTLLFTVILAEFIASVLPIAAKALKLDPAIMAGPLITTIVDACSLIIYFSIAGVLIL